MKLIRIYKFLRCWVFHRKHWQRTGFHELQQEFFGIKCQALETDYRCGKCGADLKNYPSALFPDGRAR